MYACDRKLRASRGSETNWPWFGNSIGMARKLTTRHSETTALARKLRPCLGNLGPEWGPTYFSFHTQTAQAKLWAAAWAGRPPAWPVMSWTAYPPRTDPSPLVFSNGERRAMTAPNWAKMAPKMSPLAPQTYQNAGNLLHSSTTFK